MSGQDIFTHFYFEGTFHPKTPDHIQQAMLSDLARWFTIKTKTCCRIAYGTESSSHKHCHGVIFTNRELTREIKPYKIKDKWHKISKGCIMPTCETFIQGRSKSYLFEKHQPGFTGGCCQRGDCRYNGCIYSHVPDDLLKHLID
jgi:hypothetical protein